MSVCFSSTSSFTMTLTSYLLTDAMLEVSTDGSTWSSIAAGETATGTNIYLRGTGGTYFRGSIDEMEVPYSGLSFTNNDIVISGQILDVLDYSSPTTVLLASCAFLYLFVDENSVISTDELTIGFSTMTLSDWCCSGMFRGCTSLTTAPSLPATTLADGCYYEMFDGCTSLVTAPSLPATTLADECYYEMFDGCTSLVTAPSLPATTLTTYCYSGMFYGCTSLITTTALPATTLATYCYYQMFQNCTSLTTIPALPATTLTDNCYDGMFWGCTSVKLSTASSRPTEYQYLYRIPTSGTGTTATSAMDGMFTSTGGQFTGTPSINTVYYTTNQPVSTPTVIYHGNDGIITAEGSVQTDPYTFTGVTYPSVTVARTGYIFVRWYDSTSTTVTPTAGTTIESDTEIWAEWEKDIVEKNIQLHGMSNNLPDLYTNLYPVTKAANVTGLTTLLDEKEEKTNKVTTISESSTDTQYPSAKATYDNLALKLNVSLKGTINGIAELDSTGRVPAAQLPSFVDDVLEYPTKDDFPATGESGKLYVALDTNKVYRWSGSIYVEIASSLALGETSTTAYRGDRGKIAYDHSQLTSGNPHNVSKTDIGLGNVDNTSDTDKPVSTAQATAINAKYTKPTDGIPKTDLATTVQTSLGKADTALQSHQDISGKEDKTNKVTSISSSSTDTQYPTAKCVYDLIGNIETLLANI